MHARIAFRGQKPAVSVSNCIRSAQEWCVHHRWSANFNSLLGNDARGIGISQVMPYPFNDTTPVVREYQRILQTAKNSNYSYYGIEAYVTAKVMVESIRKAGKDLTREKLVQALESMTNHDVGGYRINFSASERSGSKFVDLTVIGSGGRVLR
jgi:branched-chain amino acid transport system substrate-binding protein